MKKVSIITPCYNSESFIGRYLDSILSQTYSNLELILVNDGSTDNTINVINNYRELFAQKKIKIKCISKTNGGAASAINIGLKEFTGDYLIWPDSDDFLANDSIEKRVKFLDENLEYGLVRSDADIVYEDNLSKVIDQISRKRSNRFHVNIFNDLIYERTYCVPGCYMVRKEVLLDCIPNLNIYESRGGQNWQILLPITLKYKVGYIDESLYTYVVRKSSHSHNPFNKGFESIINQINTHEEILLNVISKLDIDKIYYYSAIELKYKKIKLLVADLYGKKDICNKLYDDLKLYINSYPDICGKNNIYMNVKEYKISENIPKTIVFGTGSYYDKLKETIKKNYNIIYFADNDVNKIGKFKDGVKIIDPNKIHTLNYDKVLIVSMYFNSICKQLINNGVNNSKLEVIFSPGYYSKKIISDKGHATFLFKDIQIDLQDISRWIIP